MKHVVIIGNGIAGITAARHIRKLSDFSITVISSENPYFFSRTALMYVYMGHMKFEHTQPYENWFWDKNNIKLLQDHVVKINTNTKSIKCISNSWIHYDQLIIATGSKPKFYGWPGEDAKGVLGLYHKKDLEKLEYLTPNNKTCKRAVIVGGGLIGVELAEMLHSRNIPVTMLVRESSYWSSILPERESKIVTHQITKNNIDIRFGVNLKKIKTNSINEVSSVIIEETGEEILCDLVGITTGVTPNVEFLNTSDVEINRGVLVNEFLETNIPDVYAIGDCAEQKTPLPNRKAIETVWYTGRIMGETVAQSICKEKTAYQPGPWFNSAKFFDLEYQTYGWILPTLKENEARFYWQNKEGNKCIHISYNKENGELLGINALGIRMRHAFFDRVLKEKKSIFFVMENIASAYFDPEFYKNYKKDIATKFGKEHKTYVKLKRLNWKILNR